MAKGEVNEELVMAIIDERLKVNSENRKSDLTKIEAYYSGYEKCLKDLKSDIDYNIKLQSTEVESEEKETPKDDSKN